MKLFLTGASGLLGSQVAHVAARRGHQVVAVVGTWTGPIPGAGRIEMLDLTDRAAVQKAVLELFPDAIINTAAISESPVCDAQPEESQKINVELPANLAALAHHLGARFIHLSSEQVFDGTDAPYQVQDPTAPVNLYGRQKVEAEQRVSGNAPETSAIVRLPLLSGNSLRGTRSVHERLFTAWAEGRSARLFSDEIRQPCSAENAAEVLVELIERQDVRGIAHWAGAAPLSRFEIGHRIAEHFKLPVSKLIESARRGDDPASARRQPNLSLDCASLSGLIKTAPESFEQLLEKLIVPPPCRDWYLQR